MCMRRVVWFQEKAGETDEPENRVHGAEQQHT